MTKVVNMFRELRGEVLKIIFLYAFLDTLMIFFMIYFLVSFFNIRFLFLVLIPGVIAFIAFPVITIVKINSARLKDVEDANPHVREMLRTAYDNRASQTVMASALFDELAAKMKSMSSGSLLDSKKIIVKIISSVAVVFLIIFVSSLNLNIEKIQIPFDKLKFMMPGRDASGLQEGKITDLVFNETEVKYGDASVAKLGDQEINLGLNPSLSDIDLSKVEDAEKNKLREGGLPQEIAVSADKFSSQEVLDEAAAAAEYSQRIKNI